MARGWLRPCDAASPPPACTQTVGYPGCQEPSPSAPLLPARASGSHHRAWVLPGGAPGQAQPWLQHRGWRPSEEKWGTARVSPGPRAVQAAGDGVWAPPELVWAWGCVPLSASASVQFSSVAQLCPTLCDPMNRSTPGLPVHHQLPEFTQTHVHRVGDAIQPSHPCQPLLLLPPIPPSIRVFSSESTLHRRWPKYWSFSFSIIPY